MENKIVARCEAFGRMESTSPTVAPMEETNPLMHRTSRVSILMLSHRNLHLYQSKEMAHNGSIKAYLCREKAQQTHAH